MVALYKAGGTVDKAVDKCYSQPMRKTLNPDSEAAQVLPPLQQ
jgi:hypothetical protein